MPFEKSVGAVVFRREKKKILYLVIQHPPSKRNDTGQWSFPKGHIEKGETWEDTLMREVKEETGISKIKIIPDFYTWIKYFYRAHGKEKERRKRKKEGVNIFKIVTFYLAETSSKRVRLSFEHINYRWLQYKEALEKVTYKSSKKVLEKANKFLTDKK